MYTKLFTAFFTSLSLFLFAQETKTGELNTIPVIFDTDANNELDDQHALIYLLLNEDVFDIKAITTNATVSGGEIDLHIEEARRIITLSNRQDVKLLKGANKNFETIRENLASINFDGFEAVNFIIDEANKASKDERLILLPVGKLTNIALAIEKAPEIIDKVKVVWLGSNYPKPGEYNQDADEAAMNYLLESEVWFEMVTVRYSDKSGSTAVSVTQDEINSTMPGLGPKSEEVVTGRHGGKFSNFGDYSVSLFNHIDYYNDKKERALFDLVAVAILKNPNWGEKRVIPAPTLVGAKWRDQPDNSRTIYLWEHFDRDGIVEDFYETLRTAKEE